MPLCKYDMQIHDVFHVCEISCVLLEGMKSDTMITLITMIQEME